MKFRVNASSFDRETGAPVSNPKDEIIDTETNELFNGSYTIMHIKDTYEYFWNGNSKSEHVVFVHSVTPIND